MRTSKTTTARNDRLEEALSLLIQSQAALAQQHPSFLTRLAETDREMVELRREMVELRKRTDREVMELRKQTDREVMELRKQTDERFKRIEAVLLEHSHILAELRQMIEALPEAIRQKIGLRPSK